MSAWVVDKTHIDLLVRAADHYGRGHGTSFRWWKTDADGKYEGWFELDPNADAVEYDGGYCEKVTPSRLGQILVDGNVRSVRHRYPPQTTDDELDLPGPIDAYYQIPYVYEDHGIVLTQPEVFAAIDCLDYQSCDIDDWRESNAYAALLSLREAVCRKVEGYDDAPWGWTAERIVARKEATVGAENH